MRYDHLDMLPEHAFKRVGKRMTLEGGGKSKAPKAPDYTAAAEATAQGNIEAARIAAKANRVSQYTPYGNLVYSQAQTPAFDQAGYDRAMADYQKQLSAYNSQANAYRGIGLNGKTGIQPRTPAPVAPSRDSFMSRVDPDLWNVTTTLSPAEQQKLELNNNLEIGLLGTAQKGLAGVDEFLSKGFNWDALPASQINAGQTAQDAIMSRLNPKYAQDEEALRTRLINQGVRAGSQAWDNEFRNFNQGKNDAFTQAGLYGIDVGQKARQQAIQEQAFGRTEGLNMVNALRTGNQVQQPNFINTPQQATTAGADYLGAANAGFQNQLGAYNAQQAGNAGLFGGLASIGGSILGGPVGGTLANRFFAG